MINQENLIKIGRAGGNTSNRGGWNVCLIYMPSVCSVYTKKITVPYLENVGTLPRFRSALPDFCASVKRASERQIPIYKR